MDDEKNVNTEEQMNSEEMFNSWSAQLMEGASEPPISQKSKMEDKAQPFNSSKENSYDTTGGPVKPVIIPIDSKKEDTNGLDIEQVSNNSNSKDSCNNNNGEPFGSSEKINREEVTNNVTTSYNGNENTTSNFNNDNVINNVNDNQPSMITQQLGENTSEIVEGNPDDKSALMGLLFAVVVIFGAGYFVYNSFIEPKFKEDEETINTVNSLDKTDDKNEKESEKEQNNNSDNTEQEQSVNDVNSIHSEELRRLCSLAGPSGEYYNEMSGDLNDINYVIENAKYCTGNMCLYTEDNVVYSRNCSSGLETKMTIEEAKIQTTLGVACITYNNTGSYSNEELGITCANNHCSATYNSRNFNQDCRKYKQ